MPMLIALAAALSRWEEGVGSRGGAAVPGVGFLRGLVGDDGVDEVPLFKDRPGAVEVSLLRLVILGPHACGDTASFDVTVRLGVLSISSPARFPTCI